MLRLLFVLFLSWGVVSAYSQSHTLFGEWKSYLPFNKSFKLTETKNKIFCTSELTVYSIDKDDFSVSIYDKTNDLNDLDVVFHEYDKYNDQLFIAYKNGNIDILKDDRTILISDIQDNANIFGNKFLYDIFIADDVYAYFASDFGVLQFNLKEYEFGFTCFTDFPVNTIVSSQNTLFIGSDNGIFSFDLNSNGNPNDFLQWKMISSLACEGFSDYQGVPVFYAGRDVYKIQSDGTIEKIYSVSDSRFSIRFLNTSDDLIFVGAFDDSRYFSRVFITNLKGYEYELPGCAFNITDAIRDVKGSMWFSDSDQNITWSEGIDQDCQKISLNSPYSYDCFDMVTENDKIYVASGGSGRASYGYNPNHKGFYILEDGSWTNYNENNNDFIRDNKLDNFINILPSKDLKKVYISSYGNGLLEMNTEDNTFAFYNHNNSKLGETLAELGRVRITDMQMDDDGNLWMTLFGAARPLVVKTADGKWYSFTMHDGSNILGEMDIDNYGQIWIRVLSKGIIVFDNKGTIEDPTDDEYISLSSQNTNLPSNSITYINTDLDGNVWVGTEKGPLVFECAGDVLSGNCSGTKKKTVLEGIAEYVLNDVNITCIEFDGANRKWIGTTSGLYVLNSGGDEEISRFTSDNSPLFDNNITSLAYNDSSGEMIIGTAKGVLSYKTETTTGPQKNSSKAYAYPNPVPHDYDGLVAFKGLARDANVKITDIEGNLIFETTAQGGQATWDARDFRGNRVGSGVYIIFSTATQSLDEVDAVSLKLFFIK